MCLCTCTSACVRAGGKVCVRDARGRNLLRRRSVVQDHKGMLEALVLRMEGHGALLWPRLRAILALREPVWDLVLVLAVKVIELGHSGILRLNVTLAAQLPLVLDPLTLTTVACSGPPGRSILSAKNGCERPVLILRDQAAVVARVIGVVVAAAAVRILQRVVEGVAAVGDLLVHRPGKLRVLHAKRVRVGHSVSALPQHVQDLFQGGIKSAELEIDLCATLATLGTVSRRPCVAADLRLEARRKVGKQGPSLMSPDCGPGMVRGAATVPLVLPTNMPWDVGLVEVLSTQVRVPYLFHRLGLRVLKHEDEPARRVHLLENFLVVHLAVPVVVEILRHHVPGVLQLPVAHALLGDDGDAEDGHVLLEILPVGIQLVRQRRGLDLWRLLAAVA
mmetsp:Transcript_12166/g.27821  ORF Transcript_12166/g.27821 Transcript_12166/m.27821 type:complete len:391 (+) Transcript_12166:75-1247(+)